MILSQETMDGISLQVLAFIKGLVNDEKKAIEILKLTIDKYNSRSDKMTITQSSVEIYLRMVARSLITKTLRCENTSLNE